MKYMLILLIATLLIAGCTENNTILVEDGDIIPASDCIERGIENQVLVIHQKGCPACAQAVPILIELDNELDIDFQFYDTKNSIEREKLLKIGVLSKHVPAIIIDCEVFIGVKTKQEYKNLIEERIS